MLHQITFAPTFAGWQKAARRALNSAWPPGEILWQEVTADQPLLDIADELEAAGGETKRAKVPREYLEIARRVACHSAPARWSLLYRMLWRLTRGEPHLLQVPTDADVQSFQQMDKSVRRDVHKMRAFVRFRAVQHESSTWYVAWFEPEHHIVELNAPFFIDRFANMCWSILTPDICAHWDQKNLTFTEGVTKAEAPSEDAAEALWLRYYSNIFNPARVKTNAMQKEMPKKYWKNLPEAAVIPALLNEAPQRVSAMIEKSRIESPPAETLLPLAVPESNDLSVIRDAALHCQACPLYRNATQTVFGEGSPTARIVLLGEQPGDTEDRVGRPFVGPAGQLLDRALQEAGIDRGRVYVTNAVKHFKWEPSGKRRLHKTPSGRDIAACRPWLEAELRVLAPKILVCLGGTAAKTALERDVRVLSEQGKFLASKFCENTFITVHPSSLLRVQDAEAQARQYRAFVEDLSKVAKRLQEI